MTDPKKLQELAGRIGTTAGNASHNIAKANVDMAQLNTALGELLIELAPLMVGTSPTDPGDPPVVPGDPPVIDPGDPTTDPTDPHGGKPVVQNPNFGCQIKPAELIPWTIKLVDGGGKPEAIKPWAPASAMKRFLCHNPPGVYTGPHGIAAPSGWNPGVSVEDAVIHGYQPWGINRKGEPALRFRNVTIQGFYGTGMHVEHGAYVGLEGWPPELVESLRAVCPKVDADLVKLLEDTGFFFPHSDVAALHMKDTLIVDCPGAAFQGVNRNYSDSGAGWLQEAEFPKTFDAPAGAQWFQHSRFQDNGGQHPAATLSLFGIEDIHLDKSGVATKANSVAYIDQMEMEAMNMPAEKALAVLLLVAGRHAIILRGGTYRRQTMGSSMRPFMQIGDAYALAQIGGVVQLGVPATFGGPIIVREPTFWSEQPTKIEVLMLPGTPFSWQGVRPDSDTAPISLYINGENIGSAFADYELD